MNKQQNKSISVIIITKNRAEYLEECLKLLLKQTFPPPEVLVVDNASTDQTKRICLEYRKVLPIKYLYEARVGTAYARNLGLKKASYPIIAFLDDDCLPDSNWLKELYKSHLEYPTSAAIQGVCITVPTIGSLSYVYQAGYSHWMQRQILSNKYLTALDTANTSFKKNLLHKFQIKFDPSFIKYCDDQDLAYQLIAKNQIISYWPKAIVGSSRKSSIIGFIHERFQKGTARAQLNQKWDQQIEEKLDGLKKIKSFKEKANLKVRDVLLNPNKKQLKDFFNLEKLSYLVYIKIRLFTFLFEAPYYLGFYFETMRLKFDKLNDYQKQDGALEKKLSVGVMIITRKRYSSLKRTLSSLINQKIKPEEVLIVDSSDDPNFQLVKQYQQKLNIKYLREKRLGFGIARNQALYHCSTDIIATIDDDAVASSDWCRSIINAHINSNALAIQGRIICEPANAANAIVEQIRLDKWFLDNLNRDFSLNTLSTKNVSFKLKRLLRLGIYFSENLLVGKYGSEDLDIANQIVIKKQKIKYDSTIKIFHLERKSLVSYIKQQYRKGCSNAVHKFTWNKKIKKKSYSLYMNKFLEPFLLLKAHPLMYGKKISPSIVFAYFASLFFFYIGLKTAALFIEKKNKSSLKNKFYRNEFLATPKIHNI